MASLTLGSAVDTLAVRLTEDADYVTGIDSLDGDWPGTAVVSLVFNDTPTAPATDPTEWVATVVGDAISWNVDKAEVNALIARLPEGTKARARLLYVDGSTDLVWAQGSVSIKTWG